MKDWDSFSTELEEWKSHPMTLHVKEATETYMAKRRKMVQQHLWAGQCSNEERLAFLMFEEFVGDLWELTGENVKDIMESEDEEQQRNNPA